MEAKRLDVHQHVTDQVVAMLDHARGGGTAVGAFRLPWHCPAGSTMRPVNVASGKPYRGVNVLALCAAAEEKGYAAGTWGTYRQWSAAGAQVRRGEKASFVVVYRDIARPADDEGERDLATNERADAGPRLYARASPVFAAEQVDGWTGAGPNAPTMSGANPHLEHCRAQPFRHRCRRLRAGNESDPFRGALHPGAEDRERTR